MQRIWSVVIAYGYSFLHAVTVFCVVKQENLGKIGRICQDSCKSGMLGPSCELWQHCPTSHPVLYQHALECIKVGHTMIVCAVSMRDGCKQSCWSDLFDFTASSLEFSRKLCHHNIRTSPMITGVCTCMHLSTCPLGPLHSMSSVVTYHWSCLAVTTLCLINCLLLFQSNHAKEREKEG